VKLRIVPSLVCVDLVSLAYLCVQLQFGPTHEVIPEGPIGLSRPSASWMRGCAAQ